MLERFNRWFTSAAGVWQTGVCILAFVIVEASDRHLDPHGFWLLYALTVYSGVTQPALAYAGKVAGDRLEALEATLEAHVERVEQLIGERDG